ncbi:RNA polymerase sigma factor [Polaribacter porphyrae]|uniref:RNA polymerase subunit sigma-70 n=1 Tax=Polaribacter porphyrae TaxID=1137780 RepID=A0A2S7WNF6_9FLAO|nr:sigma-70 family RNA polymerase sigma factor [Polaribacter porphyrae]PQJ78986.1 RNA polymerase subunit sigma-70 [Polaribacter porphyrae]
MSEKKLSVCDSETFKSIYEEHVETVRNFIYYKCGNLEQAEDLTQEAFVKLWKNCSKVFYEKAKSFLFKVVKNLFFNDVAHKKVVLNYQKSSATNFDYESPDFIMEEKEFMQKLQDAINSLTDSQRVVFLLNRIDKKKYHEIAEILGISVKTVEYRMHKALLGLRQKINFKI